MYLDPVFGFLTMFQPAIAVLIFSTIILVIINVFYKILINQNDAKALKARQNELSKQSNEARKSGDMAKANTLMSEMLKENSKLMKMTMKPMIISFVIVILLLPWPNAYYGDKFTAQNATVVDMLGREYTVHAGNGTVAIGNATCTIPSICSVDGQRISVSMQDSAIKYAPVVAIFPVNIPFKGPVSGWLFWYILMSIPLVIIIRKLMKIYV